jgi:NarL family two-component system response regulator LiaR
VGAVEDRTGGPRLRVIVADDDPLARRLARDALQRGGVVVVADASDGREAVELARYYKPDVVLMDAVMPVMDGIDATRLITSELPQTRVVMLTRSDDDELGLLGLRAGAVGYLPKGISLEALPRALHGAHAGEAVISRVLSMRLVERLQSLPEEGIGVRPIRSPLTPREWEVLDLMCAARDTHEIAEELELSIDTVRSHSHNILRKLGVGSRAEAVALAHRLRTP